MTGIRCSTTFTYTSTSKIIHAKIREKKISFKKKNFCLTGQVIQTLEARRMLKYMLHVFNVKY